MKIISLTQGKITLVDDEDYDELNKNKWSYSKGYAMRVSKKKSILMHRVIIGTPKGMETDHCNLNTLDNRRINLRICTRAENTMNKNKPNNNVSGFKGVYWHKQRRKWAANIKMDGKNKHLGLFINILDAAQAYDMAAKELFGEFARINIETKMN